ncbi:MAG: hypothetical protein E6Q97_10865 [Desulfurellales bacterium]|nr:MAG: hypothetical protein E6Q97_10865 [Desulfurellales bacterium]
MIYTIQFKDYLDVVQHGFRLDGVQVSKWWLSDPNGFVCFEYEGIGFSVPVTNIVCIMAEHLP